jgi:uncharacterized protein
MEVTPVVAEDRQLIQAYGDGGFKIAGERYDGSVVVFPGRTLAWAPASLDGLTIEHFEPVFSETPPPEILIFGAGVRFALLPRQLREALRGRVPGLGVEAMDTAAACRTYNVLLAEERRVVASLIAI